MSTPRVTIAIAGISSIRNYDGNVLGRHGISGKVGRPSPKGAGSRLASFCRQCSLAGIGMKTAKCQRVNDEPNRHEKEPFIQRNPDGSTEGNEPRKLPRELLETIHGKLPLLQVIRARCLYCCCYQPSEVRKYTAVDCVSWPYRMGRNPFSDRKANPAALEALAKVCAGQNAVETRTISMT